MIKRSKYERVTDQMRRLIRDSGVSCYAIAKETGVSNAALSRFLSGERGLSSKAMDKLGAHFGWVVSAVQQSKGK